MTDCSADLTLFPLAHKPAVVRDDGGALTSDAGALLLRRRDPRTVRYDVLSLLRQRIYQTACGYEHCNDADSLRADPPPKLTVELAWQSRCPCRIASRNSRPSALPWRDRRDLGVAVLQVPDVCGQLPGRTRIHALYPCCL